MKKTIALLLNVFFLLIPLGTASAQTKYNLTIACKGYTVLDNNGNTLSKSSAPCNLYLKSGSENFFLGGKIYYAVFSIAKLNFNEHFSNMDRTYELRNLGGGGKQYCFYASGSIPSIFYIRSVNKGKPVLLYVSKRASKTTDQKTYCFIINNVKGTIAGKQVAYNPSNCTESTDSFLKFILKEFKKH